MAGSDYASLVGPPTKPDPILLLGSGWPAVQLFAELLLNTLYGHDWPGHHIQLHCAGSVLTVIDNGPALLTDAARWSDEGSWIRQRPRAGPAEDAMLIPLLVRACAGVRVESSSGQVLRIGHSGPAAADAAPEAMGGAAAAAGHNRITLELAPAFHSGASLCPGTLYGHARMVAATLPGIRVEVTADGSARGSVCYPASRDWFLDIAAPWRIQQQPLAGQHQAEAADCEIWLAPGEVPGLHLRALVGRRVCNQGSHVAGVLAALQAQVAASQPTATHWSSPAALHEGLYGMSRGLVIAIIVKPHTRLSWRTSVKHEPADPRLEEAARRATIAAMPGGAPPGWLAEQAQALSLWKRA